MSTEARLSQDETGDEHEANHPQDLHRHHPPGATSGDVQEGVLRRQLDQNRPGATQQERKPAQDAEHAQGDDKGWNAKPGDDRAVHKANGESHSDREQHRQPRGHGPLRDKEGQADHQESVGRAGRKIDLTCNEQERHADGNNRQNRDLSGYQQQVGRCREEVWRGQCQGNKQQHRGAKHANLSHSKD